MSIVVDASVAVKWVTNEPGTDAALALLDQHLIAPAIWLAEAANALWRHVRLGEATAAEALTRLLELIEAPVVTSSIEPYVPRALQLAVELRHPVYDCIYLAVAEHHDTHVVTDDRRFARAVAANAALATRVQLLSN
jgi:predicted nucleic acid-binding protein